MSQEHGISVRNRRFDRPRGANGAVNEDALDENAAAATNDGLDTETTTTTVRQTTEDTTVNILYTPTVAQQNTASAIRSSRTRATKAAKAVKAAKSAKSKKRNRKDDDDDEDGDDYIDSDEDFLPLASSSTPRAGFKARAGRTRVEFCSQCKCRFSKLVLPGMEESSSSAPLLCLSCQNGETKKPQPKKRRRIARNGVVKKIGSNGYFEVASLQDISIRVSC
jgi:hypothetical protein